MSETIYVNQKGLEIVKEGVRGEPSYKKGWRKIDNNRREEVFFYVIFGWLSNKELFEVRQKDPRIAP
jgi:hypothetical protein